MQENDDILLISSRLREEFNFFKTLTAEEMICFLKYCNYKEGSEGDDLWNEGDSDNYAAFIMSGKLGIKKSTEFEGKYMIVGTFVKGTVAGELCLLTDHVRSVTAVILEDVKLVILTSRDFERLITDYPMLGLKLLRHVFGVISKRLNRSTDRIASIF